MAAPRCPHCGMVAFLETQECADCGSSMGFHHPSLSMAVRTDLPKTAASIRTVSLPAPLAVCLAEHMTAFVGPEPDAPLFRTANCTLPARSNLNTTFRRALATAGAPQVRFHDLWR